MHRLCRLLSSPASNKHAHVVTSQRAQEPTGGRPDVSRDNPMPSLALASVWASRLPNLNDSPDAPGLFVEVASEVCFVQLFHAGSTGLLSLSLPWVV